MLEELGRIAGLAGIAFGIFWLLSHQLLRLGILPRLTKNQGYNYLVLFLLACFLLVVLGVIGWLLHDMISAAIAYGIKEK